MFERDEAKLTKRIADMVGELIGRESKLKPMPAPNRTLIPAASAVFAAVGVRAAVRVEADLACAAALGAALAMIPVGRVKDVIADGKLDSDLAENTREVFNVMARALASHVDLRARLDTFSVLETKGAKPVKHDLAWDVSVAGYEPGKLALSFTFKAPG